MDPEAPYCKVGSVRVGKSLRLRGRCLKTKSLVTGLKAARAPDLPSNWCASDSWHAGIPVRLR
jgi:hypothetical protein